jgi:Ca2+-binding RTX toxin-like protein
MSQLTGGMDSIFSSVSYSLSGRYVENMTLTGSANLTATGNSLNNVLTGNSGNNTLTGSSGNDTLDGGLGADVLDGGTGDDVYYVDNVGDNVINESLTGGTDTIFSSVNYSLAGRYVENMTLTGSANLTATGNSLNNVLTGNSGNNTLIGGNGNDTYIFGLGSGQDVVMDTSGTMDVLSMLSGVAREQLWFTHSGNDLEVSIIGTTDKLTISSWYVGGGSNYNQVEEVHTASGNVLLSSQVESLVSAMAGFSPPSVGTTTLDSGTYASVLSVIAANWS